MKALILATLLAAQNPCEGIPNPCEKQLYRKVVQQQIHTVTTESRLSVCESRLKARTLPPKEKELKLWLVLGAGLGGVLAGFAMGFVTSRLTR